MTERCKSSFQRSLDFHLRDREISFAEDLGREPGGKREDPRSDLSDDLCQILLDSLDRDELFAFFGELDLFQFRLDRQELVTRLAGGRSSDRAVAVFGKRALDELALQISDVPSKTLRDVVATGRNSWESAFLKVVDVAFADVELSRDVVDLSDPGRSFRADLFVSRFFLLRVFHASALADRALAAAFEAFRAIARCSFFVSALPRAFPPLLPMLAYSIARPDSCPLRYHSGYGSHSPDSDMTWIVGMPTLWGYSIGISDIRVTLADGSECDCLQKIHPIAQWITLGFAGSVLIGFRMIEVMRYWLHGDQPDRAWNPLETVELWPAIARDVFAAAAPEERAGQCALLMLSADPDTPPTELGARTYVHTFRSPDFVPVQVQTHKLAGIGSGTEVPAFQQYLNDVSNNHEQNFELMKMEAGNPGGMGGVLGFSLTNMLKRTRPFGISSHLHYCWQYLGKTIIKTNDHVTIGPWTALEGGSGINQPASPPSPPPVSSQKIEGGVAFQMPQIAQSWKELELLLKSAGATANGSTT